MKSKKLISFLCAVAMTSSAFAGLAVTASAAVGETLASETFEDVVASKTETYAAPAWNNDKTAATTKDVDRVTEWTGGWGAATGQSAVYYGSSADANTYMMNNIGSQEVDNTTVWTDDYATYHQTTVTPPSVTGNKSLYFATQIGMNPTPASLTIAPAVGTSASGIYGVKFDMMLVNADHQHPNFEGDSKKDRTYNVVLGGLKLSVTNENLSYYDGTTAVDTGIDLTLAGTWFNFDLIYDATNKQFKGTMTPYNGDNLDSANAVTIPWAKFNGTATTITTLSWQNERTDGGNKGAANGAIDNFVVTEKAATKYNDISINLKSGNTVLKTLTATAEDGETYTAGDSYKVDFATDESRAAGKYYTYDSTSTDSVVSAEGASINLNFTEVEMPTTTINAVSPGGVVLAKIAEAKVVPGETVTASASEYVKSGDKWYQKNDGRTGGRGDMYEISVKGGKENVVENVKYKYAYDVVAFLEAEDSETVSVTENEDGTTTYSGTYNSNYPSSYASGGHWVQSVANGNYPAGFTTAAVAKDGTYEVSVRIYNSNGRGTHVFKKPAEGDMVEIGSTSAKGLLTYTVTAELAEGDAIHVGKIADDGSKIIEDVDYIVVKDTAVKAAPVPNVTMTISGETVSMTSDVAGEGMLIQARYDGKKLEAIKLAKKVTLLENEAVTENLVDLAVGDKIMLWDALNGMQPLAQAKISETGATPAPTVGPTKEPVVFPTLAPAGDGANYELAIAHNNDATWDGGIEGKKGQSLGLDADLAHFNNEAAGAWGGAAYLQIDGIKNIADCISAILTVDIEQGGNYGRDSKVYYLPDVADVSTVANDAPHGGEKVELGILKTTAKGTQKGITVDVKEAVKEAVENNRGTIVLYITNNAGGADIYCKPNATAGANAPKLAVKVLPDPTTAPTTAPTPTPEPTATPEPTPTTAPTPEPTAPPVAKTLANLNAVLATDQNGEGFTAAYTAAGITYTLSEDGTTATFTAPAKIPQTDVTKCMHGGGGNLEKSMYVGLALDVPTGATKMAFDNEAITTILTNGSTDGVDAYSNKLLTWIRIADKDGIVTAGPQSETIHWYDNDEKQIFVTEAKYVIEAPEIKTLSQLGATVATDQNGEGFTAAYAAAGIDVTTLGDTATILVPVKVPQTDVTKCMHGGGNLEKPMYVGLALNIPEGATKMSWDDEDDIRLIPTNGSNEGVDAYDDQLLTWIRIADKDGNAESKTTGETIHWYDENDKEIVTTYANYIIEAVPAVVAAPQVDKAEPPYEGDLAENYGVVTTITGDHYEIAINGENVVKHTGDQGEGCWVGAQIFVPDGASFALGVGAAEVAADAEYTDIDDGYLSVYMDAEAENKIRYVNIKVGEKVYDIKITCNATAKPEADDPVIATANLVDRSGAVEDVRPAGYAAVTGKTGDYRTIAINGTGVKYHQNGDDPARMGYWVGASITAPDGAVFTHYAIGAAKEDVETPTNEFPADDNTNLSVYLNAATTTEKWASVKIEDTTFIYKITSNVTLANPTVALANFEDPEDDDPDNDVITGGSATLGAGNVITLAGTVTPHENGGNNLGAWIGAAVSAPDGVTIEAYYFGTEAPADNEAVATAPTGDDTSACVGFYTDAAATVPKTYAAVKLSDGRVINYTLDLTGVTVAGLASTGGAFAAVPDADYEDPNEPYLGKKPSDLGTFSVSDNAVTGTAEYIKWTAFNGANTVEQEGYYVPVRFTAPAGATVTYKTDHEGSVAKTYSGFSESDNALDVFFYLYDDTTEAIFTLDLDGEGKLYAPKEYTVTLSGVHKTAAAEFYYNVAADGETPTYNVPVFVKITK